MRDFKNAAHRHYTDAEILYAKSRWANADHLYGLSAECILKRIIVTLYPTSINPSTGDFINHTHRKHLECSNPNPDKDLWNHFSTWDSGRLAVHLTLPNPNPFSDWDVFQRYDHESHFNESNVAPHRSAIENLFNKVDNLYANGIL